MKLCLQVAGSHRGRLGRELPGNIDLQEWLAQAHAGVLTEIKTASPVPKFHVTKQNMSCGQTFQENRRKEKQQPSFTCRPVPVGKLFKHPPPDAEHRR